MFGNKKESEPLQPFNLKVLTAQHVIEGTAPGDTRLMFAELGPNLSPLALSSVTITCIDLRQSVPRTCDRFVVVTSNVAILVPDVDPTRLANWGSFKYYTEPSRGTFHVGPYWARGTLMGFTNRRSDDTFVGIDLHVSTFLEGPVCAQFDAPFALVSTRALLGWEAE